VPRLVRVVASGDAHRLRGGVGVVGIGLVVERVRVPDQHVSFGRELHAEMWEAWCAVMAVPVLTSRLASLFPQFMRHCTPENIGQRPSWATT
jgi:hypothetical protein